MPYDASKDPFKDTLLNYGTKSKAVTPSDSLDFTKYPKAIVVTAYGNLVVLPIGNDDADTVTFTAVNAGFSPPIRVRRVLATGTTASVATIE